jgi:hypothetical protein
MDTRIEQPDGKDNGNKLTDTQKLSADVKLRIQGLEKDIAAAEEVKADMIADAGQAVKAGDMDAADKAKRIANEADQASSMPLTHPYHTLANTIVNMVYRNGAIENIHAGKGVLLSLTHRRFTDSQSRKVIRQSAESLSPFVCDFPLWTVDDY